MFKNFKLRTKLTSKFFKGVLSTEDQLIGFLKISELLEIYD